MHILFVTPFQLTATGGISTVVKMLYREFHEKGHQVSVLVPGESNRVLQLNAIKDVCVYGAYLRTPIVQHAPFRGLVAFCIFFPYTLWKLYRFLRCKKIDIIAAQYPLPWLFYFAVLHRPCTWKLVVTLQGNDVHDLPVKNWVDRYLVRKVLRSSDSVVAVAKSLVDELERIFPTLQIKSYIVPNGAAVDIDIQSSPVEPNNGIPQEYIMTAGQLIHRKGIDILIKALMRVRNQGYITNLVIIGDGPERSNLLRLAGENGLSNYIYFLGNLSHKKTLEFMKNCQFFVLSSRAEGLPLVIVEAMSCGKAVIATNVDGISEIVQDELTGLLIESEDIQSLANAIIRLYKNEELCYTLANYGREQVLQEYNWSAIAKKYLNIFEELTNS